MPKLPHVSGAEVQRALEEMGTGHLSGANPLIYRMDDSNSWRSVHQVGET